MSLDVVSDTNVPVASLDAVVNTIATHLAKQRKRSTRSTHGNSTCLYRGQSGAMCAVGCLIPDDLMEHVPEGIGARTLLAKENEASHHLLSLLPDLTVTQVGKVLGAYQVFHDAYKFDMTDRQHYGVYDSYTELLAHAKELSDEALQPVIADSLKKIAKAVLVEKGQ